MDEAIQRINTWIEETNLSGYTNLSLDLLDLSNLGLTELPSLALLDNLQVLNCSGNQLTSLSSLPNSLQSLDCSHNNLTSLSSSLCSLTNLQFLYCNNNEQLTSLSSLPNSLLVLYCCDNKRLTSLSLPNSLHELYCYRNNQLTSLSDILPINLQQLHCCDNIQLTSIGLLPNNLHVLDCRNNQLTSLLNLPDNLSFLSCNDNQLTSLPNLPKNILQLIYYNNPFKEISKHNWELLTTLYSGRFTFDIDWDLSDFTFITNVNVSIKNKFILDYAIENGNINLIDYLLDNNVDITLIDKRNCNILKKLYSSLREMKRLKNCNFQSIITNQIYKYL